MRLSNRSYPHPVVGNADDVPEAQFQATFDFSSDKTNFYIATTVRCSSRTLKRMIAKKTACYSVHVECSNTLYRRTFDFDQDSHRITIPAALICDAVEVNAFVRSKESVRRYSIDGAHEDYQDATFEISPGDILAVADGQTFDADQSVDPLRRVGSLMVVEKSSRTDDHPMEADFDQDKIRIILCEADFIAYGEMKSVPLLTSHLTTTLVLPVLMQAIDQLSDYDENSGCKWATILTERIEELGLGQTADALKSAQMLLGLPIRRALASAREYASLNET